RYQMKWDDHGNLIEIATFAADGQPYPGGGPFGARPFMFFRGWVPLAGVAAASSAPRATWRYREPGHVTAVRPFDAHDKLVINPIFGGAKLTMTYDEHGKCTEQCYFGPDGQRIRPAPDGPQRARLRTARIAARYDGDGRLISYATFDADDKPIPFVSFN